MLANTRSKFDQSDNMMNRRKESIEKPESRVLLFVFSKDNASTLESQGERPWAEEETRRSTKNQRKRVRLVRAPAYRLYPLLVAHTTLGDTAQLRSRRQTGCGRVRPDHASSAPPNRRPPSFSPRAILSRGERNYP